MVGRYILLLTLLRIDVDNKKQMILVSLQTTTPLLPAPECPTAPIATLLSLTKGPFKIPSRFKGSMT